MREIKFRGKRVDNGEWVYGYYVYEPEGYKEHQIFTGKYDKQLDRETYRVDPETVGQFIELLDTNKKEIYEGDRCTAGAWDDKVKHIVKFVEGSFVTTTEGVDYANEMTLFMGSKYEHTGLTIIGNIHDNPELLL